MAASRGHSADAVRAAAAPAKGHRPLRWVISLVAIAILILPAGTGAAASTPGVTSFYRFSYQDATSAANAARYQLMDLGYGNSPGPQASVRKLIGSIHKADPHVRLLLYKNSEASASDTQGIDGCVAWKPSQSYGGVPQSWFLKGANGAPLYDSNYGYYELDPGNSQVQQACLSSAVSMAKRGGYNGVFWDMVSTSLAWAGLSSTSCGSTSCQSDANWHAAIASFVTYVSAGLHAQGLLSIGNISGGAVSYGNGGPSYWQAFQQDGLDGGAEESFTSGTSHLPVSPTQWKQELANEAWNEANGKYFLANADVTNDRALNVYGLATLLLAAQGRSSWSTASGNYGTGEYWFPEYAGALKLGPPVGAYTAQANGLYVREFQNGDAIVNPTLSAITDPVFGTFGAQSGQIQTGIARAAGPPSTGAPTIMRGPGNKRPSTSKRAPRLSGLTYAGRGTAGFHVFAGETSFFGATARDPDGLSYGWNWGDGTEGCVAVPRWACAGAIMGHVYRRPGTYVTTLIAANGAGQSVVGKLRVTIRPAPPSTVFTAVRALGSSVATSSQSGGSVTSTLLLPSRATSVAEVTTVGGCGNQKACVSRVRRLVLGQVIKRNLKPSVVRLRLRPSNQRLVRQIDKALRKAHQHTLPATVTIKVKLANGGTVQVVQHIKLRF